MNFLNPPETASLLPKWAARLFQRERGLKAIGSSEMAYAAGLMWPPELATGIDKKIPK